MEIIIHMQICMQMAAGSDGGGGGGGCCVNDTRKGHSRLKRIADKLGPFRN